MLWNTGNTAQGSAVTYMGKEFKKQNSGSMSTCN